MEKVKLPPHKPKVVIEYCYCRTCEEYYKNVRLPQIRKAN